MFLVGSTMSQQVNGEMGVLISGGQQDCSLSGM